MWDCGGSGQKNDIMVLFFCDTFVTISQNRSFSVLTRLRSLLLAIAIQHILGALLLLFHFGTMNLSRIPDIGILRMELEVIVFFALAFLVFDAKQGGYGVDRKRDAFVFFVLQVAILSLVFSFFIHNFLFLLFSATLLLLSVLILLLWKKEEVQIAQVIE